jgi:predicted ATPase/class 3 adenylate cyclase/Tfp pilus assembly protein PilF
MAFGSYASCVETVTFLFTDVEGSTALLRRLGESAYAEVLAAHHAVIRSSLAVADGTEVDTQGDGFFAVFGSPRACAAAVLDMQRALEAQCWPDGVKVRVRMGVHTGEATLASTGWVGLDVHRAARIAAVAHGGQVVLSEATSAIVKDVLPEGAALTDLGMHRLKDLGRPERLFQLTGPGLAAEFPPLRSLGNPALLNNLPAELTPFIGRDREIDEVRALIRSSRLVTITGAGGAGKTRLALHVAAEMLDGSGDGVWLVELAAVTNEEALAPTICAALRLPVQPGRPVLEVLLDALAMQDILIVLDNCEHLIGGCAKIADAVLRRCPRVQLIATSREPLGIGGESIYRVPSLSLPGPDEPGLLQSFDAVALFAARARAQGLVLVLDEQTGPLVVSICRRLDGLPLAIELAAARLRSMSLADLHARLDQRFRLLTGGSRTAMERQQTLRAAIGWSYELLTRAEQTLLRRLAVFIDGFDLPAAEAVGGFGDVDVFDVTDLLGSLVDKSLVVAEQAGPAVRYRLLETIRQYAAEKLAEADHEEAAASYAAHCGHYLALAETAASHLAGPEQVQWLLRLDADHANLLSAYESAASRPDATAVVLRFGVALDRYWDMRPRHQGAGVRLLIAALARPDAGADSSLFCAALATAAESAILVDLPTASRLAEQALGIARELDDDSLLTRALVARAYVPAYTANASDGQPFAQEAVERARRVGDDRLLVHCLLAYLFSTSFGDPAQSDRLFAEAVACAQRSGDQRALSALHNMAAFRAVADHDIPRSRVHIEEALRLAEGFGEESATLTFNFGMQFFEEGDYAGARSYIEQSLRTNRRNGDYYAMGYSLMGLGAVASEQANWSRAAQLHAAADALMRRVAADWNMLGSRYRRDSLDRVRANLGEEQSDRAYSEGLALSLEQAIHLALDRS